jgi:hypothetical protein
VRLGGLRPPPRVHLRQIGVSVSGDIEQHRLAHMVDAAEDAAMAAGGNVAAGPRIGLHDLARGEGALLLDDDNATLNLTRT